MSSSTSLPNIAITGAMRSGKDAAAAYLVSRYGYTRFAFGDALKDVCRRLYPEQFSAPDGSQRKPRSLLQGVGQALRAFGDGNVWVNECFRNIMDHGGYESDDFSVVISDLRQQSEYARCRSEGYVILRVNAPLSTRLERAKTAGDTFDAADLAHDTERHVDTFSVDYDVYNVGTLDELYAQIDAIMAVFAK